MNANNSNYWNIYYENRTSNSAPMIPSQFGVFIANEFSSKKPVIIEFGCGNGRDSHFFSQAGFKVIGIDGSQTAIENCQKVADNNSTFIHSSIQSINLKENLKNLIVTDNILIYARFFLHAIEDSLENSFLEIARKLCNNDSYIAVEFRTNRDISLKKVTTEHYRRYISPLDFLNKAKEYGFETVYFTEGFGYAKFKDDDAHVARFILKTR